MTSHCESDPWTTVGGGSSDLLYAQRCAVSRSTPAISTAWKDGVKSSTKSTGSDVTEEDARHDDVETFLELVRAVPGPAQNSVDVARQLVSEPLEGLLAALVKDQFQRQSE